MYRLFMWLNLSASFIVNVLCHFDWFLYCLDFLFNMSNPSFFSRVRKSIKMNFVWRNQFWIEILISIEEWLNSSRIFVLTINWLPNDRNKFFSYKNKLFQNKGSSKDQNRHHSQKPPQITASVIAFDVNLCESKKSTPRCTDARVTLSL